MVEQEQQFGITSPVEEAANESIKIYKNTKGYNWDIKIISKKINDADKKRLEELNKWCTDTFGVMV